MHHAQVGSSLDDALDYFVPLDDAREDLLDDVLEKALGIRCGKRATIACRKDRDDGGKPGLAQPGCADSDNLPRVSLVVDVWSVAETPEDGQRNGFGVPEEIGDEEDALQPSRRPAHRHRGTAQSANKDLARGWRFLQFFISNSEINTLGNHLMNAYLVGVNIIQFLLDSFGRHIGDNIRPGVRCTRFRLLARLQILGDPVDDNAKPEGRANDFGAGSR